MKCSKCGKVLKNQYSWKDQIFGRECWIKYALPELLAEQEEEDEKRAEHRFLEDQLLIQVLSEKSLKRIKSQFKLSFIPSVISQFSEKGYLSWKQRDIALDLLSNADYDKLSILKYKAGLITAEHCKQNTGYSEAELKKYAHARSA